MTSTILPLTRGVEFLRMLDAKDEPAIEGILAEDAQLVDEITRKWTRGRAEISRILRDQLTHRTDVHSSVEDVHVQRWGDVEVETFVLRQVYDLDDDPCWVVSPTILVWRRIAGEWKLEVIQSIPTIG
jgi:hypothetical protein